MLSLFFDTTAKLKLGLLNGAFDWIDFYEEETKQSSAIVHSRIQNMVEQRAGFDIADIKEVYYISGPGSYTGTRLGVGIGDMFRLQGVQAYSFHHYDLPKLLGREKGHWLCNAFKKELYHYRWDGEEESQELIPLADVNLSRFSYQDCIYTNEVLEVDLPLVQEENLFKDNVKQLLPEVKKKKLSRDIFYFRTSKNEFKLPSKP